MICFASFLCARMIFHVAFIEKSHSARERRSGLPRLLSHMSSIALPDITVATPVSTALPVNFTGSTWVAIGSGMRLWRRTDGSGEAASQMRGAAQAAQAAWAASVALEGGAVTLLLDCHHGRRTASCKAGAGRERVGLPQLHDRRRQPHGRRREYAPPHGAASGRSWLVEG